jgi:hypothetical protein
MVKHVSKDRSLDELPDEVFVALGRRGMEGIPLKECTYGECDNSDLQLIDVQANPAQISGSGQETQIEDWEVKCPDCDRSFTIRLKSRFFDGEKMDTMVNIIDDEGKDLGWLGSY